MQAEATHILANTKQQQVKFLLLPLVFSVALLGIAFTPRVESNLTLKTSFIGAFLFLVAWLFVVSYRVINNQLELEIIPKLVRVHWVQSLVHVSLYTYWGLYWPGVSNHVLLLLAQILFSYAFLALLAWSQNKPWLLTFGPLPIIFSTNLFLWFKDDWFAFQFLMVAIGFLGKEFITWKKEGRRAHIFNPSGFSLSVFSIILIFTGTTNLTSGTDIATTLVYPPHIYLFIFALGFIVQSLFAVTLTTLGAIAAFFVINVIYTQLTGLYWFFDSNIPVAVFLGAHLLVTDPSTSPRTDLGRFIFGMLYGASVFALQGLLESNGVPTFYDKLLFVPLLNLSIQWIDRVAKSKPMEYIGGESFGLRLSPARKNYVHMSVWIVLFAFFQSVNFTGKKHEGGNISFWVKACNENGGMSCARLEKMYTIDCDKHKNAESCNTLGGLLGEGKWFEQSDEKSAEAFRRACVLGLDSGCINAASQFVFFNIPHQLSDIIPGLARACEQDSAPGCYMLGTLNERGKGVPKRADHARKLFARACKLGDQRACGKIASL